MKIRKENIINPDNISESIESEIRKQIRVSKLQQTILTTVAFSGLLSVSLLAPNALKALKVFDLDKKLFKNSRRAVYGSRDRLIENGLMVYTKDGYIKLTKEGEIVLRRVELSKYKVEIPKKWDKKWRIVIFDIKEKRKNLRDSMRDILSQVGFVKLQNSVWVYPYDCEDLMNLSKANSALGRELLYIVADRIENEKVLLEHFKLKR